MVRIPEKTEAIVRSLARIYASKERADVVELLAKASAEMVESSFDNWNGGTYGYTLRLSVPAHLYVAIEGSTEPLEKELLERARPFLRGYENEHLEEVVITLELESDDHWRENALAWLKSRTQKHITSTDFSEYDFFVSHASEDKAALVRPLAENLRKKGGRVWYDEFELKIGDSLRRSIDRGLSHSRFRIVVLSAAFFSKNWPQYELDGLTSRQIIGRKVILPIWHDISREQILQYSPSLADMLAFESQSLSIEQMVDEFMGLLELDSK
jgi:hypothetical protein